MAIDLKTLKPTTVSRDLKGKFVFLYGAPKVGKTTLAVQFPKNLILGFEHGWNAIDNVMAVDVPTWAEFKKYVKQLSDDAMKEQFHTITIDTVGLAYERCEAYICSRESVDKIGDIPYGAGYKMVDKEFDEVIRKITLLGYGLVLIGHEKVRIDSDGQTSVKHITPDISDRAGKIINRMVDLTAYIGMENGVRYIYPRQITIEEGKQVTEIYAGSHFANLNDKIELSYDALVNAIADAMVTNSNGKKVDLVEAPAVAVADTPKLDFASIRKDIAAIAKKFAALDEKEETPYLIDGYKQIVETYLGKGKLVRDCDESQVEHLSLILEDLQDYAKSHNVQI